MKGLGGYAFLGGLLLSVIASFIALGGTATLLVVVLGLVVGLLNIQTNESIRFLVGVIGLSILGGATLAILPTIGGTLASIIGAVTFFAGAAAIPVSIRTIYDTGKK